MDNCLKECRAALPSRREQAFRWSFERYVRHANENGEKLYWWSFTTKEVIAHWRCGYLWKRLTRWMHERFRYDEDYPLAGIRICELQKRGAIHWHAVINKRIPIGEMRRKVGNRLGLGWCKVYRVWNQEDMETLCRYMLAYLVKESAQVYTSKIQRWGMIGGFPATTSKDIVIDSPAHRAVKKVSAAMFGGGPLPYWLVKDIFRSVHADYPARVDFAIYWAREHIAKGNSALRDWSVFNWPIETVLNHMEGIGENPLDGNCPF